MINTTLTSMQVKISLPASNTTVYNDTNLLLLVTKPDGTTKSMANVASDSAAPTASLITLDAIDLPDIGIYRCKLYSTDVADIDVSTGVATSSTLTLIKEFTIKRFASAASPTTI